LQSLDAINGVQRILRYIDTEGKRQDTAHRYLHPRLQDGKHPNLHVVVESQVVRVNVEQGKANAVVFRPNPKFHAASDKERSVKARKMVIVSCGALGTPLVLERSGIGSAEVLERAGIPLLVDLPGVGNDYQDHQCGAYPYKTNLAKGESHDDVVTGRTSLEELLQAKSPMLGYNTQDVTCKMRPSEEEVTALGPEFEEAWRDHFRNKPDRPVAVMALLNA
jgi:alcohol oxidase